MAKDDFRLETIDLEPYFHPKNAGDRQKVIDQVVSVCMHQGFFQVNGHGIPLQTQDGMIQSCRNLFHLPKEEKLQLSFLKNMTRRGYEASGDSHRVGDALPDSKEAYYVGREEPVLEPPGFHGPNVWPNLPEGDFRGPVTEYFDETNRLGRAIWEILIQGLGHPADTLENFSKRPFIQMKLICYPPQASTKQGQFGVGPHNDFGGVTVLLQQPNANGLEVWHEQKQEWVQIPALRDVFVINVGDMLQNWSGGNYKSAKHRVINKTVEGDGERISIATFWHGDVDATNPFNPNDPSKDTVGSLVIKRFGKQFSLDVAKKAVAAA